MRGCFIVARLRANHSRMQWVSDRSAAVATMLPHELSDSIARLTNKRGYINAGIPRFEYLFGRDSIISALQLLKLNPEIARCTLLELARLQGRKVDNGTEEEPGKILHECYNNGDESAFMKYKSELGWLKPDRPVYFSIDSTPLFLILFSRYYSYTRDISIMEIAGSVDNAVMWLLDHGIIDGLVRYGKPSEGAGLLSQSWKDGVGKLLDDAVAPVAVVEVQGYAYAALTSLAPLYRRRNPEMALRMSSAASMIRERLEEFWMPDERFYALSIDGSGRKICAVTSNPGHLLFTGILPKSRAAAVVSRLMRPDMLTPYGIRTHSSLEPDFDERSYQRGSVWPHDNGMIAMGMERTDHSASITVAEAVLRAYRETGGAPEYLGVSRSNRLIPSDELEVEPCTLQGWSVATIANMIAKHPEVWQRGQPDLMLVRRE